MRLQVNPACEQDVSSLLVICTEMAGTLRAASNYPRPLKGPLPTEDELLHFINEGMLFAVKDNLKVLGGVALTRDQPDAYRHCQWLTKEDEACLILRYFIIHPNHSSSAPAWELMRYTINYAKKRHMKSIRCHLYENDISSICVFEDSGFRYVGYLDLGFRSYGMHRFRAYELLLKRYESPRGSYVI